MVTAMWRNYYAFAPMADGMLEKAGVAQDDFSDQDTLASDSETSSSGTRIRSEFPETWLWADHMTE